MRALFDVDVQFVAEIRKYHESGKGLFIWADNEPLYANANFVLDDLFGVSDYVLFYARVSSKGKHICI